MLTPRVRGAAGLAAAMLVTGLATAESGGASAGTAKAAHAKRPKAPKASVPLSASASAGVIDGLDTLPVHAAVVVVEVDERPELKGKHWRLRTPVGLEHRETMIDSVNETRGDAAAELRWRAKGGARITGEAGAVGVWRPDWPDPYQPNPDGTLATTDRHSHLDRFVALTLADSPRHGQFLRLGYEYRLVDYTDDPRFEPVAAPTHLVPGDHDQHSLAASYNVRHDRRRLGMAFDLAERQHFFAFARDAGTGLTHAGAGGPPPNPLARFWYVGGDVHGRWSLPEHLTLELEYAHRARLDPFDGYYTYHGPAPSAGLTWRPRSRLSLELADELAWRFYGPGSYRPSDDHPPLETGSRLFERRNRVRLAVATELEGPLEVFGSVELSTRRTNYPDYRPGVFPAGRAYSIDWDYDDSRLLVGVRWTAGGKAARDSSGDDDG